MSRDARSEHLRELLRDNPYAYFLEHEVRFTKPDSLKFACFHNFPEDMLPLIYRRILTLFPGPYFHASFMTTQRLSIKGQWSNLSSIATKFAFELYLHKGCPHFYAKGLKWQESWGHAVLTALSDICVHAQEMFRRHDMLADEPYGEREPLFWVPECLDFLWAPGGNSQINDEPAFSLYSQACLPFFMHMKGRGLRVFSNKGDGTFFIFTVRSIDLFRDPAYYVKGWYFHITWAEERHGILDTLVPLSSKGNGLVFRKKKPTEPFGYMTWRHVAHEIRSRKRQRETEATNQKFIQKKQQKAALEEQKEREQEQRLRELEKILDDMPPMISSFTLLDDVFMSLPTAADDE